MFPDPERDSIAVARAYFQHSAPAGAAVEHVFKDYFENGALWTTTYHQSQPFPALDRSNCHRVKAILQRMCPVGGSVGSVYLREYEQGRKVWAAQYYYNNKGADKTRTASRTTNDTKIENAIPAVEYFKDEFDLDKISIQVRRDNKIILLHPSEVTDTDLPCRLIANGRNLTSRFVGRWTLCKKVFHKIRDILSKGYIYVRSFLREMRKTTLARSIGFVSNDASTSLPIQEPDSVSQTQKVEKNKTYAAVSYTYETEYSDNIIFAKFRDVNLFRAVRQYIVSGLGISGRGTFPLASLTVVELANVLKTNGLPLDKSLFDKYCEYCRITNISKEPVRELCDYVDLLRKSGKLLV